ncbi:hypothetical protein [Streptomyces coeruleorubidus]|uniref:hypothetical protein n=1 Tax=Streptomyces coeruleorubidus TaxID=116188 RepID=UPI0036546E80
MGRASEKAAVLARESPSRSGVTSGLVAEVRPQPAAELFQPRFCAIEEQFPAEISRQVRKREKPSLAPHG